MLIVSINFSKLTDPSAYMHTEGTPPPRESAIFVTTLWNVVLQAGVEETTQAQSALQCLCEAYWFPLYAYVRRQGHNPEDAQDLTQEFFARMLERKYIRLADQKRGRFRTFLLTSLKHFLINEWNKGNRAKRGGGRPLISLDAQEIETRFLTEASDGRSPDKAFDRRWALIVLERALDKIEREFAEEGRANVFAELKATLTGDQSECSYAELGIRLGLTEGNLKVIVHRLRRRYRELLREEIARTVDNPGSIDREMRDLMAALTD